MRKKITSLILIMVSLILLVACGQVDNEPPLDDKSSLDVRIASLKGPTTIGLAHLMDLEENKDESLFSSVKADLDFQIFPMAEEVVTGLAKGEIDLATLPANLAATLYNKTEGQVRVVSINTLGVLYMVENGNTINSLEDLEGKTIYTIGKGTTPDGVLNTFIQSNNLENVNLEYRSEASEIASLLKAEKDIIALLPEPFVSVVMSSNPDVKVVFDMNEEWKKINDGKPIVTGVLLARKDFIDNNKDFLDEFLNMYEESIGYISTNIEEVASIVESKEIIPEGIGEQSIPNCNIKFIKGKEMKNLLEDYLQDLYNFKPELIGGTLPEEEFYY